MHEDVPPRLLRPRRRRPPGKVANGLQGNGADGGTPEDHFYADDELIVMPAVTRLRLLTHADTGSDPRRRRSLVAPRTAAATASATADTASDAALAGKEDLSETLVIGVSIVLPGLEPADESVFGTVNGTLPFGVGIEIEIRRRRGHEGRD